MPLDKCTAIVQVGCSSGNTDARASLKKSVTIRPTSSAFRFDFYFLSFFFSLFLLFIETQSRSKKLKNKETKQRKANVEIDSCCSVTTFSLFFICFFPMVFDNVKQILNSPNAGGGNGTILQLFPARIETRRLWRHILAKIPSQNHGWKRSALCGRLRHLLSHGKVSSSISLSVFKNLSQKTTTVN